MKCQSIIMEMFGIKKSEIGIRKIIVLILSFVIPVIMATLIFYMQGIYYGSEKTILLSDMLLQYLPFYASLRNIFSYGNSLHFNWSCALGGNYLGLFTYYLASPITWLLGFCDLESLPDGIYLVTLLRIGLCGLSLSVFLLFAPRERRASILYRNDSEKHCNSNWLYVGILFLSVCYALMSYVFMYSMSLMWLDGVILLPLVIWGVELLLEGKIWPYTVTVFVCLFCNYYTAYMILLFSFLFFIGILYIEWDSVRSNLKTTIVRYLLCNIIAIGLDAPFLCATIANLKIGKGEGDAKLVADGIILHNPIQVLKQILPQQYDSINTLGLPSLFCGIIPILLALTFFVKGRNKKEKIVCFILLSIIFLSFFIGPIDRIWHGFREPVCFPHRYSFIWVFLVIFCAYRGYSLFLGSYLKGKSFAIIVLYLYTTIELTLNAALFIAEHNINLSYKDRFTYSRMVDEISRDLSLISANSQDKYERIEINRILTDNDPMLMNYHGLTHFSSTYNKGFLDFCKKLGMLQYHYKSSGRGGTPFSDTLLNIRYLITPIETCDIYEPILNEKDIYKNPYSLGMGFVTKGVVSEDSFTEMLNHSTNPFEFQNALASSCVNEHTDIFKLNELSIVTSNNGFVNEHSTEWIIDKNYDLKDNKATIVTTASCDGPLYLSIELTEDEEFIIFNQDSHSREQILEIIQGYFELSVNGKNVPVRLNEFIADINSIHIPYNYYLGDFRRGEVVTVELSGFVFPRNIYIALMDMDEMQRWFDEMENRKMALITDEKQNDYSFLRNVLNAAIGNVVMQGELEVDKYGTLVISLPYDSGYRIYIDNELVETKRLWNALLSTNVSSGHHSVCVRYISPGWNIGMAVCALTIILVVCMAVKEKEGNR